MSNIDSSIKEQHVFDITSWFKSFDVCQFIACQFDVCQFVVVLYIMWSQVNKLKLFVKLVVSLVIIFFLNVIFKNIS